MDPSLSRSQPSITNIILILQMRRPRFREITSLDQSHSNTFRTRFVSLQNLHSVLPCNTSPQNEELENHGQIDKRYTSAILPNSKSRKHEEWPSFHCEVVHGNFIFLSLTLQLNINPIQFHGTANIAFSLQPWSHNTQQHLHLRGTLHG